MHSQLAFDELRENLASKEWRLNNLYWFKDEAGFAHKFKLNWCQEKLLADSHGFDIVLKARQLGVTTYYCLNFLDDCLFNSNITAVLIADDLKDAKKILADKVRFAYDRLPLEIRERRQLLTDSTEMLKFSNGSSYSITTSARSGTVQRLHITEFGKICRKEPAKADEIIAGSLNTVHSGQQIVIESTAEGQDGHFYNLCQKAQRIQRLGLDLTPLDFKFHFFSWVKEKKYQLKGKLELTPELVTYFKELQEEQGIILTDAQKLWYSKKAETLQELTKQEFPATPEEAFEKAIIGAYFAKQIAQVEKERRILPIQYDESLPVYTFWDIGMNDTTAIWFVQKRGFDFLVIDYYENSDLPLPHYLNTLTEKKYKYGKHFLPHDIVKRSFYDGKDGLEVAKDHGFKFEQVERPQSKIACIDKARNIFKRCFFNNKACESGLTRLRNYRKGWNERLGCFTDQPLHDINSNGADAFQTFALSSDKLAGIGSYDVATLQARIKKNQQTNHIL
ncbi:MAG: terminase [Proteobacteria bacterium]|nr:terminase [Pseudomonadota bacterium]